MARGARLLVVGLDGATWDVVDAAPERVPTLAALARGGVRARLRSTTPPMTLPAWSSILTGVNPGRHGILDFTRRMPGQYRLELLNASYRRVPALHELLSARGRRVASLLVPGTWPPRPVDGVVIAGFDSPVATTTAAAHCRPRALHRELVRRFGPLHFADLLEGATGTPGWHRRAQASLVREIGRKEAVCRWLLDRERWDCFMVVFGESDTAAHHLWAFHDPRSPRHVPGWPDALLDVYARLDGALARLAADADQVCVVSDHGFGPAGTLALYLNRFLEAHGWLRFHPGGPPGGQGLRKAALALPVGALVRNVPDRLLSAVETRVRWGGIDFARTRAWSDEMNYTATVHLNLRGRDPAGTIADADAAVTALTRLFLDWRVDGAPVVERVRRRDEVCRGPAAEGAPDLVLELALHQGASPVVLPSAGVPAGTTWRRLSPEEHLGAKGAGMNGAHRPDGLLVLHGPPWAPGREVRASVEDVLPALLAGLGEPVPDWVEGRVPPGALRAEGPLERDATPCPPPPRIRPTAPLAAASVADRLSRLGYL